MEAAGLKPRTVWLRADPDDHLTLIVVPTCSLMLLLFCLFLLLNQPNLFSDDPG